MSLKKAIIILAGLTLVIAIIFVVLYNLNKSKQEEIEEIILEITEDEPELNIEELAPIERVEMIKKLSEELEDDPEILELAPEERIEKVKELSGNMEEDSEVAELTPEERIQRLKEMTK